MITMAVMPESAIRISHVNDRPHVSATTAPNTPAASVVHPRTRMRPKIPFIVGRSTLDPVVQESRNVMPLACEDDLHLSRVAHAQHVESVLHDVPPGHVGFDNQDDAIDFVRERRDATARNGVCVENHPVETLA